MTLHDTQRDRLLRTIEWAREIERHLAAMRARHVGKVHFRPASTGIAMIGLLPDRPQRGKSSITTLAQLATNFEAEFRTHCVDCDHGRPTPEKRLQSRLIAEAYRHDRRLLPLAAPDLASPPIFVTDELALPVNGGRIVCDLLALSGDRPVIVELKPSRAKKRLVEQVTHYAALVEAHITLFGELCSVILGREVTLRTPCARWIVWPAAGHERDPQEDALADLGIRVVGYEETDQGFTFRVGRDVADSGPDCG